MQAPTSKRVPESPSLDGTLWVGPRRASTISRICLSAGLACMLQRQYSAESVRKEMMEVHAPTANHRPKKSRPQHDCKGNLRRLRGP
eukprot:914046-Pelagomonas_calceolata.AAC.7